MEKIHLAAMKFTLNKKGDVDDGKEKIIIGSNHSSIIYTCRAMDIRPLERENEIQGFITTEGRFVTREEAYTIAKNTNQLNYPGDGESLYSEQVRYA